MFPPLLLYINILHRRSGIIDYLNNDESTQLVMDYMMYALFMKAKKYDTFVFALDNHEST